MSLMTALDCIALDAIETRVERQLSARPTVAAGTPRVVLLLHPRTKVPGAAVDAAMAACDDRGWRVATVTNVNGAAVELVRAGLVDVVVVPVNPGPTVELELLKAGVRLEVLR